MNNSVLFYANKLFQLSRKHFFEDCYQTYKELVAVNPQVTPPAALRIQLPIFASQYASYYLLLEHAGYKVDNKKIQSDVSHLISDFVKNFTDFDPAKEKIELDDIVKHIADLYFWTIQGETQKDAIQIEAIHLFD